MLPPLLLGLAAGMSTISRHWVVAASEVAIQLDSYCDNSIRVRLRPATPPVSPSVAATSWIGPAARGSDSVLCLSSECTHSESTSGYTKGIVEGYAPGPAAPSNSTIELAVYYQRQHTDNLVGPANSTYSTASFSINLLVF